MPLYPNELDSQPSESSSEQSSTDTVSSKEDIPKIDLPKGGGAINSIGEKFQANPVTGTGSTSVPLPISPGRNGFTPALSLQYDSGNGNGSFGAGWNVGVPSIVRKTQKGLPKYQDNDESDIYILAGAEDLVPALVNQGGEWLPVSRVEGSTIIKLYRPRTEGLFAKIEKHTETLSGQVHWKVITKDNITTVYGASESTQVFDSEDTHKIFEWLIAHTYDEKGNVTLYEYKTENTDNLQQSRLSEKNRLNQTNSFNKKYLKSVKYNPDIPFSSANTDFFTQVKWNFQLVFDYGEHDQSNPTINEVNPWPVRQDPFSTFRSGFEVRTYRLCRKILMFHSFENDLGIDPVLVKSTDLSYDENPVMSQITEVTQRCYQTGESPQSYPPISFQYTKATIDPNIHQYSVEDTGNLPAGVDSSRYRWVDLYGEGLQGVLLEDRNAWYFKENLGDENYYKDLPANTIPAPEARLSPIRQVRERPSIANLTSGGQQLTDLDGNGTVDLVVNTGSISGYYTQNADHEWDRFIPFESYPNIDFNDPNVKLMDVNGDGFPDIIMTEDNCFTIHQSENTKGYSSAYKTLKSFDDEQGPAIVFADAEQSVYLADMSGDGLTDIVKIKNGSVCYWPNMGYGTFGAKVSLDNAPHFDYPDHFNQNRIRLADIDGSGTADIVYIADNEVRYYPNQSGNSFGEAVVINERLPTHNLTSITALDILGNGTQCLVWSSPVPGDHPPAIKFVDLMGGVKPYLMTEMDNNMGSMTRLKYAPSTKFYLKDKREGNPWITKLPFPVQVVERVELYDAISHNRFVTKYAYHHGYFDGVEREFRGFGMIEQMDTETFTDFANEGLFPPGINANEEAIHVPPVLTKTWFHTGFYQQGEEILSQYKKEYWDGDASAFVLETLPGFIAGSQKNDAETEREAARALKGSPLRQEVYSLDGSAKETNPYTVTENSYRLQQVQPRANQDRRDRDYGVYLVTPGETLAFQYERNPEDPRISHQLMLETDAYGNVLQSAAVSYPRRTSVGYGEQDALLVTLAENTVINVDDNVGFYRIGLPKEAKNYQLMGIVGNALQTSASLLAEIASAVEIPFENSPDTGLQKRLINHSRVLYYDENLSETSALAFGQVASHGLPFETYQLALTPGLIANVLNDTSARVDNTLLVEAQYRDLLGDGNYWVPSGKVIVDAANFYLPIAQEDPFGNRGVIAYDSYHLLPTQTTDALGNVTAAAYDYRTLQADLVTDPNGNQQAFAFDVRGMVTKIVVMGKDGEYQGDTMEAPTTLFEYDLFRWVNEQKPNYARTESRESHFYTSFAVGQDPVNTYQLNLSTSGAGEPDWIDLNGAGLSNGSPRTFTIDGAISLFVPASGWLPGGTTGAVTGDDSGAFPDSILGGYWAGNSGAGNYLEFQGLNPSGRYDIDFIAGRIAQGNNKRMHDFVIQGATTVNINNYNASDNTSILGQVSKMQPDTNGNIRITDNLSGDTFWRMNAIVLKEFYVVESGEEFSVLEDTFQMNLSPNGSSQSGWLDFNGSGNAYNTARSFAIDDSKTLFVPADGWLPGGTTGAVTGDDSGVFPDSILGGYWAGNSGPGNYLEVQGLDTSKRYDIDFLAGRIAQGNANRRHDYVILGATSVTISDYNASDNTDTLGQISKMQPDVNGFIRITDNRDGDGYWRMNAIVLREYSTSNRKQESYAYSDGLGQVIMTKNKVAPGDAFSRDINGDLLRDGSDELILMATDPRWVGSGRTIQDNKGNPIKQYEPYFSSTSDYESEAELVEYGVTPVIRYDPLGRAIRTDLPDDTLTRVEFTPWEQKNYDQNDTVLESLWYVQKNAPDPNGAEPVDPDTRAAWLAAKHADTPQVTLMDTLGRPFVTIDNNGSDGQYTMTTQLDIKGNPLSIVDAKGRASFTYIYNMLDQPIKTSHLDNGTRYAIGNVVGNPLRAWDDRNQLFRYIYDQLQRPVKVYLRANGGAESLISLTIFGETLASAEDYNLKGQPYLVFDSAGLVKNTGFDFKGNLLSSERQLADNYQTTPDWISLDNETTVPGVLAAMISLLSTEVFGQSTAYDALNRPTFMTKPDSSEVLPIYDEGSKLLAVDSRLRGAATTTNFVSSITYNQRGQRDKITYANGSQTTYYYDTNTFRLTRLLTTRNAGIDILQDLNYTFDPSGNIVEQIDHAQQTLYYDNTEVSPNGKYTYDALYRLITSEGRELIGLNASPDHTDVSSSILPNDTTAMRLYGQSYEYDELGNIDKMIHTATGGNWTKHYHYGANNYLLSTSSDGVQPTADHYSYDAHGNMMEMPHLASVSWDYADRMQSADLGGGGTAYYTYDAGGNRVRKVIDKGGGLIHERIYLGDYEVYRETQSGITQLERETLHISDDTGRIALVDTLTMDGGFSVGTPAGNIRYQLSNHLGSASLELDDTAAIISYEEYHAFGTTAYRSGRNAAETSLKRYRYVGKERDEETGLYYYGARYYAAWLCRFISVDPLKDEYPYYSTYQYAGNKPITFIDLDGLEEALPPLLQAVQRDFQNFLKQKKTATKPEQATIQSDNTRVGSLDQKKNFINSSIDKNAQKQNDLEKSRTPEGFALAVSGKQEKRTDNGTISAQSLRHPGVDRQSFRMATQDRVFQATAISIFTVGTAVVAGEVIAAESFKKVFQTKIEEVAAGIAKDIFGQLAVKEGDITKVDFANAIASGFVKNNTLKNLISAAVDFNTEGFDTKKYESEEGVEKLVQEFFVRQLADGIFNSYKEQFGSNLPKGFNADVVLDVVKKEFRILTNEKIDQTQKKINQKLDEQKRE